MTQYLWVSDKVGHDGVGTGRDAINSWHQSVDPGYQTNAGTHSGGDHIWADASVGVPATA